MSTKIIIPPVGSGCAGNISLPHIDHTATAVMRPVKAISVRGDFSTASREVLPKKVFCVMVSAMINVSGFG